ncbi:MATE family efflux transporter [soil metagenome]
MPAAAHQPALIDPSAGGAVREMLKLAAPTVATMASYTVMQFVDALVVSKIQPPDPIYLAAQGNGGVWAFVPMSIFMGLAGVVNTYVAQNLGAGDARRGAAYVWNALWLALIMWVFVILPMAVVSPHIFALLHIDANPVDAAAAAYQHRLVDLESGYNRILLLGGIITMWSRALSQFFYGMHRPQVTLIAAVAGNLVNFGLNQALVLGHFGAPALGIRGSALATVIGTAVELIIPLSIFLSAKYNLLYATRSAWRLSLAHIRDILRIGWPQGAMYGNEIFCWAVFMTYLSGKFGINHNMAGWIVLRFMHLSFMPAVGISFACTAAVGRCLGAGRPDLAAQRARIGVAVAMFYMGLCAVAMILFRVPLVSIFIDDGTSPEERAALLGIAAPIMIIAAIFQVFDGLGIALLGVLRGAGDTVWPGVATIILSWTCIIGLGFAFAYFYPNLESRGPWIAAAIYVTLLGLVLLYRFRTGPWRTKLLLAESEGTTTPEPVPA